MPFSSDREALRALVDAPDDAALREAVCIHLLSPIRPTRACAAVCADRGRAG